MASTLENPILAQAGLSNLTENPVRKESDALLAVKAGLEERSASLAKSTAAAQENIKTGKVQGKVLLNSMENLTSIMQNIQREKDTLQMQAENATINALEDANVPETQALILQEMTASATKSNALRIESEDIKDDKITGIAIVDSFLNAFRSIEVDTALAAEQKDFMQSAREMSNISAAAERIPKTNANMKRSINDALIELNYEQIGAEGKIKHTAQTILNAQSNSAELLKNAQLDQIGLNNLMKGYQVANSEEAMAMRREEFKVKKETAALQLKKWEADSERSALELERTQILLAREKDPKKIALLNAQLDSQLENLQTAVRGKELLVQNAQLGQSILGQTPQEEAAILTGYKMEPEKYLRFNEVGTTGVIGGTLSEARDTYKMAYPAGGAPETAMTRIIQETEVALAKKYAETEAEGGKVPGVNDKAAREADFNNAGLQILADYAEELKPDDASNPLAPPPMATIVQSSKAFESSALYKNVLEPQGIKEINPQDVFNKAMAGIQAGSVNVTEAAEGLLMLAQASASYNSTDKGGLRRVGLPSQETFNVRMKKDPSFMEKLKVFEDTQLLDRPSFLIPLALQGENITGILGSFFGPTGIVNWMDITELNDMIIKSMVSFPPLSVEATAPPAE